MKQFSKLTLIALAIGTLLSVSVFGSHRSPLFGCRSATLIDVRGNSELDANGDGKVTIAEVAVANPLGNLDTLVTAVLAADSAVLDALSDPDTMLTVFAPDNDAFGNVPGPILNEILADTDVLTAVLLYHVVAGKFDPRRVWYIRAVDSLLGQNLFVKRARSNPTINQSNIGCTGVRTDNGYVWIIDSVLLPQF